MREMGTGDFIVAALAGFLGGFVFLYGTDFALLHREWCNGSGSCLQSWVSALSGWAAFAGAMLTIAVLRQQTSEARKAAKTAEDALVHNKATAVRQVRAYISLNKSKATLHVDGSVSVAVSFKNTGTTPASDICVFAGGAMGRPTIPKPVSWDTTLFRRIDSTTTSGAMQKFGSKFIISADDVRKGTQALIEGRSSYLLIKITYKDIFSEERMTAVVIKVNLGDRSTSLAHAEIS